MIQLRLFRLGLALAVTGVGTHSAWAFTLEGNSSSRGWDTTELTIKVNPASCPVPADRFLGAVDQAIQLWNSVPTSGLHLTRGDSVSTTATEIVSGNSAAGLPNPLVVCDPALDHTISASADTIAGSTLVEASHGEVIDYGYILLNSVSGAAASVETMTPTQLSIVIAHEMGHLVGLGHSQDKSSLMYFDGSLRTDLSLSQDDMDGITFLYPRGEVGKNGIFGCGTLDRGGPARQKGTTDPRAPDPRQTELSGLLAICLFGIWIFKRGIHIKTVRG